MAVQDQKLSVGAILSSQELIEKVYCMAKPKFNQVYTELVYGLNEAIPAFILHVEFNAFV